MPTPRRARVVRQPINRSSVRRARPIRQTHARWIVAVQNFFLSFTPSRFKSYWMSRAGLMRLLKLAGVAAFLVIAVFAWYAKDLPSPSKINARVSAQSTKFYDRTGKTLLYELSGNQNRTIITFDQMPANLKQATLAIEDKNFYKEGAFSFIGYFRAAIFDLIHRGAYQGGSTITQQYVKNALLDPTDHTFGRKIKELILSLEISQFYSKDDILKLYLNEIPYGSNAYGVEAACRTYFPQDTQNNLCAPHLTLPQSALLAAVANAPTYYSPYGEHTDDLLSRQHLVLNDMAAQHYISQSQADSAKWKTSDLLAAIPKNQNLYANITAPNFVLYTQEQLEAKYGTNAVTEGGLKVITTLNLKQQQLMEQTASADIDKVRASKGSNIAMVSADPKTGQVLAMIGSYDFNDPHFGNYNAALANRQPGSSFKPFVYSTLFSKNKNNPKAGSTYGAGTVLYDVKTNFGGDYQPQNDTGQFYGALPIRNEFDGSLNIPAVKALYLAGIQNSIDTAHSLGITTLNDPDPVDHYGLSLVLGSGEVRLYDMVNAYESFANGGQHYAPTTILKVTDAKGNVLEDNTKSAAPKQVLDPQVAYLVNSILGDVNARKFTYFNDTYLLTVPGYNTAAKTGTTNNFKDAWTIGYTPDLVTGVWVGNNDNTSMSGLAVDIAAPVWHDYMTKALPEAYVDNSGNYSSYPKNNFNKPDGIQTITLDADTGRLPTAATKKTETDIFPSWYRAQTSTDTASAKVDKVSGKLATDCTPPAAIETVYSSNIVPEIGPSDPEYQYWLPGVQQLAQSLGYNGSGSIPTTSDDAHSCSDAKPTVSLNVSGSGTYTLRANITAGKAALSQVQFYLDDQIISTQSANDPGGSDSTYTATYTATDAGSHTFKVQVTDQLYYQASDSQSVNTVAGGGGLAGVTPVNGGTVSHINVLFSWTPDPGTSSYTLTIDGSTINTSATTYTKTVSPGSHTWSVKANDTGNSTSSMSFTAT